MFLKFEIRQECIGACIPRTFWMKRKWDKSPCSAGGVSTVCILSPRVVGLESQAIFRRGSESTSPPSRWRAWGLFAPGVREVESARLSLLLLRSSLWECSSSADPRARWLARSQSARISPNSRMVLRRWYLKSLKMIEVDLKVNIRRINKRYKEEGGGRKVADLRVSDSMKPFWRWYRSIRCMVDNRKYTLFSSCVSLGRLSRSLLSVTKDGRGEAVRGGET